MNPTTIAEQERRLEAIARIESIPRHQRTPAADALLAWLARKVKENARG